MNTINNTTAYYGAHDIARNADGSLTLQCVDVRLDKRKHVRIYTHPDVRALRKAPSPMRWYVSDDIVD